MANPRPTPKPGNLGPQTSLTRCTFPVLYPVLAPERGPEWQTHARRRNLGRVLSPSPPSFYTVAAARTIRHPTNALGLQVAQAEVEAASSACLQAYGNRDNLTLQAGP